MLIPTEVVGSLPRPDYLQQAYAEYDSGKISKEELIKLQDKAAADSLSRMQQTGEIYISDGEQRSSSFATYPILDTLGGTGLNENLSADGGQYFAIFDDGHHRQLPKLIRGPFKYKNYAWQNFQKSLPLAKGHSMKQAVIAPSMMYLLYPLSETLEGYSKDQFEKDLIEECEKDIRGCFEAGAKRVSIDFTEGRLALKNDPRNPWTGASLLDRFIELNNSVLDRFSPAERANIGVHTCPGGDCDSVHSSEVPYHTLLPSLFRINAGYFLIQLASENAATRASIHQEIGKHLRRDAKGVKQVAFIGVINPLDPVVETPEQVCESLLEASKHIPVDQLGATDDCGYSPFSIDRKPKHGGNPDFARDIAFQKISARIQGSKMASEKLRI
ncbi:hypothetical protein GGU10DRAFT_311004 [Lentinula aff. detonsa]|uniref:UROD/MetE-like protein n=1 Tax=Lentinula aff. detonsa TaxID=2804958 RepID=A0AA38KFD1_9AGAR|nr:hypothetical protein GGU10DRAFT_311004 [Lentinula aff. detonsa]